MKQKLQLNRIRKPINIKINHNSSMELQHLADGSYGDVIDYDVYLPTKNKNLQRPFVWSLQQKQELIISVLKGINIPPISVITYRDDISGANTRIIKIIDGKQRLSTLISFYKNEFALSIDGDDYFFTDLEDKAQTIFHTFYVSVNRVYEYPDAMVSDDDKIAWFEMINFAGTQQDIEHLNDLKT